MLTTRDPELAREIIDAIRLHFNEPYSEAFERLLHHRIFTYEAVSVAKSQAGAEILRRRERLAQDPVRAVLQLLRDARDVASRQQPPQ